MVKAGNNEVLYKVTPYRWLILLVVTLSKLQNVFLLESIKPIKVPAANAFGINVTYLNYSVIVSVLTIIPMTPLSVYLFSRYSIRGVLVCAMTLQLVAGLLRALTFYTDEIWPVMMSQLFAQVSFDIFMNS